MASGAKGVSSKGVSLQMDPVMLQRKVGFNGRGEYREILRRTGDGKLEVIPSGKSSLKDDFMSLLGKGKGEIQQMMSRVQDFNLSMKNDPEQFYNWIMQHDKLIPAQKKLIAADTLYYNIINCNASFINQFRESVLVKNPDLIDEFRLILGMKSTRENLITDSAVIDQVVRHLNEQRSPMICASLFDVINKYKLADTKISFVSRYILDAQYRKAKEKLERDPAVKFLNTEIMKTVDDLDKAIDRGDTNNVLGVVPLLEEMIWEKARVILSNRSGDVWTLHRQVSNCIKMLNKHKDSLKAMSGDKAAEFAEALRILRSQLSDIGLERMPSV